jgi:hypothetical protein
MKPTEFLKNELAQTPAPRRIGEVSIGSDLTLCHRDDLDHIDSLREVSLESLTELVKTTPTGEFRPLRSSPDLSRGWKISSPDFMTLVEALRILYPGAIAHWSNWSQNTIRITPYQETAERQTGMYHCTRLLNAEQLSTLTQKVCALGCLKKRLWEPTDSLLPSPGEIPLLCPEACNFLVAKAREVVKAMNPKP